MHFVESDYAALRELALAWYIIPQRLLRPGGEPGLKQNHPSTFQINFSTRLPKRNELTPKSLFAFR